MWHIGGLLVAVAADNPASGPGGGDGLLVVVGGIVVAAIGGAVTVIVAVINSRNTKRDEPVPAGHTANGMELFERTAVLSRRADDNDDRDEAQDRRLDQIERILDIDNPQWRHSHGDFS